MEEKEKDRGDTSTEWLQLILFDRGTFLVSCVLTLIEQIEDSFAVASGGDTAAFYFDLLPSLFL